MITFLCSVLGDLACCFFQTFALLGLSPSPSVALAQGGGKFDFGITALSGLPQHRPSMEQQQLPQGEK